MTVTIRTKHSVYTLTRKTRESEVTLTSTNPRYAGPILVGGDDMEFLGAGHPWPVGLPFIMKILPGQGFKSTLVTSPVVSMEVIP